MSLVITISGNPKSGKSTAAHLIADCLQQHGFDVEVNDTYGDLQPRHIAHLFLTLKHRILRALGKTTIGQGRFARIDCKMLPRPSAISTSSAAA